MNTENLILSGYSSACAFELVVGLNGYIWIKGDSVKSSLVLANLIQKADNAPSKRIPDLIKRAIQELK